MTETLFMKSFVFASLFVIVKSIVRNSSHNCPTDIGRFTLMWDEITDLNSFSYNHDQYHILYHYKLYRDQNVSWRCGRAVSDNLVLWNHWGVAPAAEQWCDPAACRPGAETRVAPVDTPWRIRDSKAVETNLVALEYDWNDSILSLKYAQHNSCDPKVWRHRAYWYAVLTDTREGRGRAVLYRSGDLRRWRGVAVLAAGESESFWMRAEFFELGGRFVLVKTARIIRSDGDDLDHTEYLIGRFNYSSHTFVPGSAGFNTIDTGFDFSAARTTEAADGRRVLVGRVGAALSTTRELRVSGDSLLAEPAREYRSLRGELVFAGRATPGAVIALAGGAVEVIAHAELRGTRRAMLRVELGGARTLFVWYDAVAQEVVVRRTGTAGGERRAAARDVGSRLTCRLFVDVGSVEVFWGAGESVFSIRVFPTTLSRLRVPYHSMQFHLRIFKVQRTIPRM